MGTRKSNSCSHSSLVSPNVSTKFKKDHPAVEKTSEWRAFNLSSIDAGSSQNFSLREGISLEGTFLAMRRYRFEA